MIRMGAQYVKVEFVENRGYFRPSILDSVCDICANWANRLNATSQRRG